MAKIIVLSGPVAVGKTQFGRALEAVFPVFKVSTRKYIIESTGTAQERSALQRAGDKLDEDTGGNWVADAVAQQSAGVPDTTLLLVDSARIVPQVEKLKERFGRPNVRHIHLTAPEPVLSERYLSRPPRGREFTSYADVKKNPTEAAIGALAKVADIVVDTSAMEPSSQVSYALTGWLPVSSQEERLVDVYVGGQWGSEGKGNICSYLAHEYSVLMRVGGPNAGHKVADPEYTYVQLPSGTGSTRAKILIAAGSTIWLPTILKEIEDHPWLKQEGNLIIDGQAMIIDPSDREIEASLLDGIASTKQGVGAATARKVIGRGCMPPFGTPVRLARDETALFPYLGDTKVELDRAYRNRQKIMLEGTQGTDLSIHHGSYPKVTSRETTASGSLADAGIGPHRVRKVVLVTRTYPIRVGGDSGPMGIQTSFEEVSRRSGLHLGKIRGTERGSVSGRERRIAEFNWEQLRRSSEINSATDVALTFVDYLDAKNGNACDFASLTKPTQDFIGHVERVSGRPVTLISKGFGRTHVIDRRGW